MLPHTRHLRTPVTTVMTTVRLQPSARRQAILRCFDLRNPHKTRMEWIISRYLSRKNFKLQVTQARNARIRSQVSVTAHAPPSPSTRHPSFLENARFYGAFLYRCPAFQVYLHQSVLHPIVGHLSLAFSIDLCLPLCIQSTFISG